MQRPRLLLVAAAMSACSGAETVDPPRSAVSRAQGAAEAASHVPQPLQAPTGAARPPTCAGWADETEVSVEDTSSGAALVFSTSGDIVALRRHVAELASVASSDGARLDHVPRGVRMIFEPPEGDSSELRETVTQRGRDLVKRCQLAWNPRGDVAAKKKAATAAPRPSDARPATVDPSKGKDEAKTNEVTASEPRPANDVEKKGDPPKDGGKPKDGDEPKDGDRPKDKPKDKPKEPPPPPPPGPPPSKPPFTL